MALGLKQLEEDPWITRIPSRYQPGSIVKGKVTKITNFGVFVELEGELEGLLHVSELADHKVENPEDVVKVGEIIVHPEYGRGKVETVLRSSMLVRFPNGGLKSLMLS